MRKTRTQATIFKVSKEELCLGTEGSFLRPFFVVLAPANLQMLPESFSSGVQSLKTKQNLEEAHKEKARRCRLSRDRQTALRAVNPSMFRWRVSEEERL